MDLAWKSESNTEQQRIRAVISDYSEDTQKRRLPRLKKIIPIVLLTFFNYGCNNSKKIVKSEKRTIDPIIEKDQTAVLTENEEKVVEVTIVEDIQTRTESCEKNQEHKTFLEEIVFLKILEKNPSNCLLNRLNKRFGIKNAFMAAKDGNALFKSGILIGYESANNHNVGYLINISDINFETDSTALIDFSLSRTSLNGVSKTYQLEKSSKKWKVTGCKVTGYS